MSKSLFITGGSGYIGSKIVEFAIADGYTVTALSRSEASDAKLRDLGASPVRGDLTTLDVLTREAAKADIVISIADSIAGDYGMSQEERGRINSAGMSALSEGLKGTNKLFINTGGSLLVAADPDGKETDESSPLWPDKQFDTGGERLAMSFQEKGIRVCSVRLAPYVYGRGGSGVLLFLSGAAKAGACTYVDEGAVRVTTVHVDDAARLYLLVAQKGRSGEAYNAVFENNVTQRQLSEAYAKVLDLPTRSIPYDAAESAMGKFIARFLSLENRASGAKARKELGWEPKAEKGILEEITTGSYVKVAENLRKSAA
ncbi:putative NAD dependent epimerase/dehydratase [Lophiostoma macrostomum CBS 122681]|uniref:Putative NAD dependent epimerase/dehydratase n=1 Tax=Lophiostoma macrostomum CBS 122681 TaxID=1314788 RepID=A0A6A6SWI6_9PLEO|nr:putative NAD dependent epimerase/dehydratase [Lophiostoma macrostomum CBS 122681]